MKNLDIVKGTELVGEMMTNQINFDIELLGADNLTPNWFDKMLNVLIESVNISFENSTSEGLFKTAVSITMNRKAYQVVFPKVGMDENGNYTTNPNLWA